MKKYCKILLISVLVAGSLLGGYANHAKATVTITPMMVLFEGRDRYKDINLINTALETNGYAVEWLYFKQQEDNGLYYGLESSPTEFDVGKHVVYTPRRFSLKPRDVQKIRLALRLNGEPPAPGDYRAHLLIKKTEEPTPGIVPTPDQPGKVKAAVKINVGFSIPVIYRSGTSDVTAHLGNITTGVNKNTGNIEVTIPIERRGGPFSLLGHLYVYNNDKLVGEVENANVFSEIKNRDIVVGLSAKELLPGTLRVLYKDFDKDKDIVLAEKTVPVGN